MCSDGSEQRKRDVTESQRALELRKFFAPQSTNGSHFNETLNDDGALDAYAETVVWRLHASHSMVSLVDRGTQYFLAGAIRTHPSNSDGDEDVDEVSTIGDWFGCTEVGTPGGLCENTLAIDRTQEEYPCFIINDLSKDDRFSILPVVDGTISSYKFYAGTPITTSRGINIGSLFIFDTRARHGLSRAQRKFLYQQAANVMKHLETKREAAERHRVALMSKGISRFLEISSAQSDEINSTSSDGRGSQRSVYTLHSESSQQEKESDSADGSVLDKIRLTLDHAANILRDSLQLVVGGVVFLDTAIGYNEADTTDAYLDKSTDIGGQIHKAEQEENADENKISLTPQNHYAMERHISMESTRSSDDRHKAAKVLSMSAAKIATWDPDADVLDAKTLQALINTYPKGNVWYIDDEGYFDSLEQMKDFEETISPSSSRRRSLSVDLTTKKAEATMLAKTFHNAKQIIFLPLWDAGGNRWYSGCFIWSQSAVPVFTVDSEIAYLSAFTNSVMVEISRLDAITSNKMKSDFISSISHEFRSPLHGILASAEFLKDSKLDASQSEFVATVQSCSTTLLDTINHVLDYSKINSFEKSKNSQGTTILNELYQTTNVALLCEDIVNDMVVALSQSGTPSSTQQMSNNLHKPLEIIIDIENKDWEYQIQPGALRRVVMNLFGNAQKYTLKGYIILRLTMNQTKDGEMLCLQIRDSGKGISAEYMERKMFHAFAQEDSFAAGVGLGLSIVYSIVSQLGGKISVRSEIGKGTDVDVQIPIEPKNYATPETLSLDNSGNASAEARSCIANIRGRARGKKLSILRRKQNASRYTDIAWISAKRYCAEWFGFTIEDDAAGPNAADIVVTDAADESIYRDGQRVLLVYDDIAYIAKRESTRKGRQVVGTIHQPLGPFKLCRALLLLMDQDIPMIGSGESGNGALGNDMGTQTPLGTPEERTILNGIIMNDYGFMPQSAVTAHSAPDIKPEPKSENKPRAKSPSPERRPNFEQKFSGLEELSRLTLADSRIQGSLEKKREQAAREVTKEVSVPATSEAQHQTASKGGLRLLAVDDNALNLQLLTRYLAKRKEDTITVAHNGVEAVEAVRNLKPGDKFDCIFMDISMPIMDGFEATRLIRIHERSLMRRASLRDIKIILEDGTETINTDSAASTTANEQAAKAIASGKSYIAALTGLASRKHRDEADDSGFDDYLTKPTPFLKIGALLKRLSEEKMQKVQELTKEVTSVDDVST